MKVITMSALLYPCFAAADCGSTGSCVDETSLVQVKKKLKLGGERLEKESAQDEAAQPNPLGGLAPAAPVTSGADPCAASCPPADCSDPLTDASKPECTACLECHYDAIPGDAKLILHAKCEMQCPDKYCRHAKDASKLECAACLACHVNFMMHMMNPVNASANWTDYAFPLTEPMLPPIGHPSLAEVDSAKNDSATNWTERWTNYLAPYDRESWPPLKPEEVVPTLVQTGATAPNASDVNVSGVKWTDYGFPLTAPMPPPIGHPSLAEVDSAKNDSATNWTERWTNYLAPYDRESWPPLKPKEVVPTGH